jgi:hypothetical protein
LIIIVVEIVILFPIVQKVGFFELFGAVNIFICYAATFAGSPAWPRWCLALRNLRLTTHSPTIACVRACVRACVQDCSSTSL